jgi:hypothetical protein
VAREAIKVMSVIMSAPDEEWGVKLAVTEQRGMVLKVDGGFEGFVFSGDVGEPEDSIGVFKTRREANEMVNKEIATRYVAEAGDGYVPAWMKRELGSRKEAHDSGDRTKLQHCPFCGSGQIVGRSDGTAHCDFCGQTFTVHQQPDFSASPQTENPEEAPGVEIAPDTMEPETHVPGEDGPQPEDPPENVMAVEGPQPMGQPGQSGTEPVVGEEQVLGEDQEEAPEDQFPPGDEDEDDDDEENGKKKKKPPFFSTLKGHQLSEDDYLMHLAIRHADIPSRVVKVVREQRVREKASSDR